jgi:hypothetical protein
MTRAPTARKGPLRRVVRAVAACAVAGALCAIVVVVIGAIGAAIVGPTTPYGPTIRGGGTIVESDGRRVFSDHPGASSGKALGSVQYVISIQSQGRPNTVRKTSSLTVAGVAPEPGVPGSDDTLFWRRAVGEAVSSSPFDRLLPPGFAASDRAQTTEHFWRAYLSNGIAAVGKSTGWFVAWLVCAVVAVLVGTWVLVRDTRRGPRACAGCGYDLTGLSVTRCPECGAGLEPAAGTAA